jgi:cytosine/uracil/thiamine/allantoin permease
MSFIIAVILVTVAAAYLTSIPCRAACARGRRPAWLSVLVGTIGAAFLAVLFICQGDLFRPSTWNKNKMDTALLIPAVFTVFCVVGVIPAVLVLTHYGKRFEHAHPAA